MKQNDQTVEPYPSVWESLKAQKVFADSVRENMQWPDVSLDLVVKSSIDSVWRAGRAYQIAKNREHNQLTEEERCILQAIQERPDLMGRILDILAHDFEKASNGEAEQREAK